MGKKLCRNCHERTRHKMGRTSSGRAVPLCRICDACKCSDCVAIAERELAQRMKIQPATDPDPMRPPNLDPRFVWGP
jgi:hypothetical protein